MEYKVDFCVGIQKCIWNQNIQQLYKKLDFGISGVVTFKETENLS